MLEKLKLYIENYKQYRYWAAILVILGIAFLIFIKPDEASTKIEEKSIVNSQKNTDSKYQKDEQQPTSKKVLESNDKPKKVMVDIKGAVKHPDVYEMSDTQRIKDILSKAIPTDKADLSLINLSEKLVDQKMIYIPEKGKEAAVPQTSNINNATNSSSTNQQKVNVNTAKESELTSITGLGPTKAIIEYRENKGRFDKIDQLKEIKGFGDKTYEKLKEYLTV